MLLISSIIRKIADQISPDTKCVSCEVCGVSTPFVKTDTGYLCQKHWGDKSAAQFINPFPGLTPDKKIDERELTRTIRQAIAAEEEAVHFYEAVVDATDNELAKKAFQDIANEEKVHIGEFQALLNMMLPEEQKLLDDGKKEVSEMGKEATAPFKPNIPRKELEGLEKVIKIEHGSTSSANLAKYVKNRLRFLINPKEGLPHSSAEGWVNKIFNALWHGGADKAVREMEEAKPAY